MVLIESEPGARFERLDRHQKLSPLAQGTQA